MFSNYEFFDKVPANQVFLDDAFKDFWGASAIPNTVGNDHYDGARFAYTAALQTKTCRTAAL